jgi:hypothetical protein
VRTADADRVTESASPCADELPAVDGDAPIDVDALIARVPPDRQCRSFFLRFGIEHARREGVDVSTLARVDGHDIGLAHSMRETFALARLLYPHVAPRESLRRLGGLSVPALLSSPFGKLAFGFVRLSPLVMLRAAPKLVALSGALATVSVLESKPGRCVMRLTDFSGFRDMFVGAAEAALAGFGLTPAIGLYARSETSFDISIAWSTSEKHLPGRYGPGGEIQKPARAR